MSEVEHCGGGCWEEGSGEVWGTGKSHKEEGFLIEAWRKETEMN